jgi:hypothetical protein
MGLLLIVLGLGVAAITDVVIRKVIDDAAFAAGRRRGLLQAADVCKMRSVSAMEMAPVGQQLVGMVRAQVADNIASELLTMANEKEE